ncbi:MAG TPA: pyruvate kinase [Candidatus Binatia bacterium]|nr:pyruvate kinase [Candidatus Binatia bacterium]
MRHTKIVCTVGPATNSVEMLRRIVEAGADVLRLNFSHGTPAEHRETAERIRAVGEELKKPVAILQDLPGPKIRIGSFKENSVQLHAGETFTLTTDEVPGDERRVSVSYDRLPEELRKDQTILLADGAIEFKVENIKSREIDCRVIVGGSLSSHKGVNVPRGAVNLAAFTDKDREFLSVGLEMGVDIIALSFIRSPADIAPARRSIAAAGMDTPVMAKIEKPEALDNFEEVLAAADSIMVARGDLGVEIPLAEVPFVQKSIIAKAVSASKPVVTATQMLRSMVESNRPTRAEVTDVANAVLDGSDALMLSEESAVGAYPVEAVQTLAQIAEVAERHLLIENRFTPASLQADSNTAEAIGHAACLLAWEAGASAIVCCTRTGQTARLVAKHRPAMPIIAASPKEETVRRLMLTWGVRPLFIPEFGSTDRIVETALAAALQFNLVTAGAKVVIASATPETEARKTDFLRVVTV